MPDRRWDRMWELFHECSGLPPHERERKLGAACADDPELRAEILELLSEHDRPSTGLEGPRARSGDQFSPGDRIGPYVIEGLVGEGGMGLVYRARQTEPVQRTVALKLIRPGMDSREVISRFRLEQQSLAILEHPNIARVHDADTTPEGRPYFAMELVEGVPITTYCIGKALSVEQRLELFGDVCAGVQHAHQRGIIHRDLKPSNVLVAEVDGKPVPKIIDFGIARATTEAGSEKTFATELGRLVGTPEYMSPEQAGFGERDIDTRTDVYALGALLYELLAGCPPFDWKKLRQKGLDELRRVLFDVDPRPPSERLALTGDEAATGLSRKTLAGDLDWIVLKALEKDRERRYDSPSALAEDLRRCRDNRPVMARPPSRLYRLQKFTRRHRVGVVAVGAVVLAILAGATIGAIGFARAVEARKEAEREARSADRVATLMSRVFYQATPSGADFNTITLREAIDKSAEFILEELQDEPVIRGRLLLELGTVYWSNGIYPKATRMIDESLKLLETHLGADHRLTLTALSLRGHLEYDTGRYNEARATLERCVELSSSRGHDGPGIFVLEGLGNVYGALELYAEQRRIAERVLEVYQENPQPDDLGRAYYNLALAMAHDGAGEEVEQTLRKAIALFEKSNNQARIGHCYNSLAILYWNREEFGRARPLLESALEVTRRTVGEEHPYTASMLNNLGLLHLELKNYDEARDLSERAYALRLKALGPDHGDVATSVLNLARLYAETGERERAIEYFEKGLDVRSAALGETHSSLVGPLRRYASFLEEWNQPEKAQRLRGRAEAIEPARPTNGHS